jgi:hypothetical protein
MACDDSPGLLIALVAKGIQDYSPEIYNSHSRFLTGIHQFSYQKLSVTTSTNNTIISYTLLKTCDFVNKIDLLLPNPNQLSINKIIKSITILVGNKIIDKINGDVETIIKTDSILFKRKISHINDKTFIPLNLAPLYSFNMIQPSYKVEDVKINVEYCENYNHHDVELYGNKYVVDTNERKLYFNQPHSFHTIQHQYIIEKTHQYISNYSYTINFDYPLYAIYFWGIDKITNIRLSLNGYDFYNGTVEALEHYKLSRGYDISPIMFLFSENDFDDSSKSTINFSRIDSAQLYISTDQREDKDVHIVALSLQTFSHIDGFAGIKFL